MSKKDRYKEEIAFRKQIFFVLSGLVAGLLGWLANHYQDITIILLGIAGATVLTLVTFAALEYRKLVKLIERIEDQ